MRDQLQQHNNERKEFTALFERLGSKAGYMGSERTILLKNIRCTSNPNIHTDHLWFNLTKGFADLNLQEGDELMFQARVRGYRKGYRGADEQAQYESPIEYDYKLSHPTNITLLNRTTIIFPPQRESFKSTPKEPKIFSDFGKGNCKACGKKLPPMRRFYCSDPCGTKYRYETSDCDILTWDDFRLEILIRDNYTCLDCEQKRSDNYLDVHHIIPIHKGGDQWDPDNCMTLCIEHHRKRHRKQYQEPSNNQVSLDVY